MIKLEMIRYFWKELFLLLDCWKQLHEWAFYLV